MSLAAAPCIQSWSGNGTTGPFSFTFPYTDAAHIRVRRLPDGGSLTTETGYTLTAINNGDSGGSITLATELLAGETLYADRVVPLAQPTDLRHQGGYNADNHERALDYTMMAAQQIQRNLDRAVLLAEPETGPLIMPSAEARPSTILGFDSSGLLTSYPSTDAGLSSITATGSTTSRTLQERFTDHYNLKDWASLAVGNDWTNAINTALSFIKSAGGGRLHFRGVYQASNIVMQRGVIMDGGNIFSSELKQLAGATGTFIKSENFDALTGQNKTVYSDSRVPSWYGLVNCRVNGGWSDGNTTRTCDLYGCALIFDNVVIYNTYGDDAFYTEYAINSGSSSYLGQEEGLFGNIFVRNTRKGGWRFRGPHNSNLRYFIGAYIGEDGSDTSYWGLITEESAGQYSGLFDYVGTAHNYMGANNQGLKFGASLNAGYLLGDGDNVVINAQARIGILRATLCGKNVAGYGGDGITLSGSKINVAQIYAELDPNSDGRWSVVNTGSRNHIGTMQIYAPTSANVQHGYYDEGDWNTVNKGYVKGFHQNAANIAIQLEASTYGNYDFQVEQASTHLKYTTGSHNTLRLRSYTGASDALTAGSAPGSTDKFEVKSGGTITKSTFFQGQTGTFAVDSTGLRSVSIAHNCPWTPAIHQVKACLSGGNASDWQATLRVSSVDATNVNLEIRVGTASGTGGALGRATVEVNMEK